MPIDLHTYLINLDQDTERLALITSRLNRLALPFERVPAIHSTNVPDWLRPYFFDKNGRTSPTLYPGEIGCYASHLLAMKGISEGNVPALILEDDLEFADDFLEILASIRMLPKGWDVLKLTWQVRRKKIPIDHLPSGRAIVKYARVPWGTGAYLITPEGARKFLNWKTFRTCPIDQDIRRNWDCGLIIYGVDPAPVTQNVGASTIGAMGKSRSGRNRSGRNPLFDRIAMISHDVRWLGLHKWLMVHMRII